MRSFLLTLNLMNSIYGTTTTGQPSVIPLPPPLPGNPLSSTVPEQKKDPAEPSSPKKQHFKGISLKEIKTIEKPPLFDSSRYKKSFTSCKVFDEVANKNRIILSDCLQAILSHPDTKDNYASVIIKSVIASRPCKYYANCGDERMQYYSGVSSLLRMSFMTGFIEEISKKDENLKNSLDFLNFIFSSLKSFDHREILPYASLSILLINSLEQIEKKIDKDSSKKISNFRSNFAKQLKDISNLTNQYAANIEAEFVGSTDKSQFKNQFLSKLFTKEFEKLIFESITALGKTFLGYLNVLETLKTKEGYEIVKKHVIDSTLAFQTIDLILDFMIGLKHYDEKSSILHMWHPTNRLAYITTDLAISLVEVSLKYDEEYYDLLKASLSKENIDWWEKTNAFDYFSPIQISTINEDNIYEYLEGVMEQNLERLENLTQKPSLCTVKNVVHLFVEHIKFKRGCNKFLSQEEKESLVSSIQSFETKMPKLEDPSPKKKKPSLGTARRIRSKEKPIDGPSSTQTVSSAEFYDAEEMPSQQETTDIIPPKQKTTDIPFQNIPPKQRQDLSPPYQNKPINIPPKQNQDSHDQIILDTHKKIRFLYGERSFSMQKDTATEEQETVNKFLEILKEVENKLTAQEIKAVIYYASKILDIPIEKLTKTPDKPQNISDLSSINIKQSSKIGIFIWVLLAFSAISGVIFGIWYLKNTRF